RFIQSSGGEENRERILPLPLRPDPVRTAATGRFPPTEPSRESISAAAPTMALVGSTKYPLRASFTNPSQISLSEKERTAPPVFRTAARTSRPRTGSAELIPSAMVSLFSTLSGEGLPFLKASSRGAQFFG